ncbi:MAG: GldG family protein [Kiritimatiellia bacterium]
MNARPPASPSSGRVRRAALRANLGVAIALAAAIFAMVNYLSLRHYSRVHWSHTLSSRLSEKSIHLLASIEDDVRAVALVRPSNEVHDSVAALLQEYAAHAASMDVEFVDPDRDLARAEQLVRQYDLPGAECVVFEIGGRSQAVPAADLLDFGYPDAPGERPRRVFRGEQFFSSALLSLTQTVRPAVFFTQGHGERSPDDFDRHSGFSRIAARLRDDNVAVETLNLGEARTVPNHCALMVVAGPVQSFAPFETALIRDYLDRKGRLLLLLDARVQTGLEPLLATWGVVLGDDVVIDETRTLSGRELYVPDYPPHPITASLDAIASVFFLPRSVRPRPRAAGGDKPSVAELAASSPAGWAEFDPDDPSPHYDPQVDISGAIPVAVAIERGPVPGVHVQIRSTRLVVVGDSDFASNSGLMGANADFFLNAANWLLEREELMALSPASFQELRLVMDARQLRKLFGAVVVVLPALVAALGVWVAWRRRS